MQSGSIKTELLRHLVRHQRVVVRLLRQKRVVRALLQEAALAEDADLRRGPDRRQPKLKGSIGEGPNQTNYSAWSSVRILPKISFRNFP